ncbi:hypothetical protein E143388_07425 [Rhodococcus opacus]|nr:hypothetical protein E143388_07425 [Rhodococcus opacus]
MLGAILRWIQGILDERARDRIKDAIYGPDSDARELREYAYKMKSHIENQNLNPSVEKEMTKAWESNMKNFDSEDDKAKKVARNSLLLSVTEYIISNRMDLRLIKFEN